MKASAGAPYQPHTTEQHWRLSLPAVLYPTCNTTCHHFLDPSLSLSFSFSSLSLSHVLKAFLPLLTFLSSLKSFLLSACHLLFHLSFPSSYPFTSISRTLSHVLAVFCFFFCFLFVSFHPPVFLAPALVFCTFLPSIVLLARSPSASQRRPNKQLCRFA